MRKNLPVMIRKYATIIGLGVAALLFMGSDIHAADLPGSKDHPLFKRFNGSEIVGYVVKRFDEYELQTSAYVSYDIDADQREFTRPPLKLEGGLTRIWYEAAGEASSAELIGNYRNELSADGFEILYDSASDPEAKKWSGFLNKFGKMDIQTNRSKYVLYAADKEEIRVLTAKKARAEGDIYVYLTAVEWSRNDATYKARKGAYAALDIIEVRPMKQNMVVVKADEMSKAISLHGRVALYGILFDTNQAVIKPESKPAMEQIALLLKQEPNLSLHVVGHTDNQGGFEHNSDLSRRRADAVKAMLTEEYGIAAGRLTSNGVAYLAPVASNANEDGRAKNRRVELVPR